MERSILRNLFVHHLLRLKMSFYLAVAVGLFAAVSYPLASLLVPRLVVATPLASTYDALNVNHQRLVAGAVSLAAYPITVVVAELVSWATMPLLFATQCAVALLLVTRTRNATVHWINTYAPLAALPAHAVLSLTKTTRSRRPFTLNDSSPIASPDTSPLLTSPSPPRPIAHDANDDEQAPTSTVGPL